MPRIKVDQTLTKSANLFPVVGIGASAGGLDAFKKLLKAIPESSGMAYVLVQHLDPNHESLLPEILQKVTKIPVLEITDDIKVLPDHIYVIPANKMMVATDGVLLLAPRPAKSKTERNLPIDLFFASLAEIHQEHAIGVVLSGTASDGTQGLKAIKEHGGITFAQDEASAEYEGMPHSAAQAGVVDFILPPHEIPNKLLEVTKKIKLSDEELQNIPKEDEDVFKQILSLLRIRKGVDFTYYKQTTVRRRILRRMLVNKNEEPGEYLTFLRGHIQEQDLLYQDMLIPVTSFFRDKKVFESLCKEVFPAILKNKVPGEITRIWVAGCSTGQEVYSFAICFKEFLGDNHERIQIFGTDLSEPAILKARTGIYEKSELDAVSAQRLAEHFTKHNGGYQVNKSIRNMCVFAHHNFLKDPPFGKMDCISCRNVLIYMEPYLQKKALTTFHYALNANGFLLLGKSETTGGVPDLFVLSHPKDGGKNDKLYTRKDVPSRFMQVASPRSEQILNRAVENSKSDSDSYRNRTDFQKTADDILLTKYTPAGVVVNEAMDIVHFRGNTTNYLEQAPGKPSHNLMMMAKHGLGFELRNILHKAKTVKAPVVKDNIPLSVNGSIRTISIEAVPLPNTLEPYYLLLFHDNNLTNADGSVTGSKRKVSAKTKKDEKDIRIQLLEQELAQAREDMRSITEDQEASNEELQSANEELLSGSEELQSLNEELETSKEELQSTNEELTVLNHELLGLNEQVTDARNYSESIVATLYQPLLVIDKNLRVKTANNAFYKTFNVNEQETEGVLVYDLGNRQWNIPELRTLLEEILPRKKQITDFEVTHNFTSIGERIILLNALEITREKKEEKLILLSIEDITEQRLFQSKEKKFLSRFHNLLMQTPVPIAMFRGSNYVVELVNDSGLGVFVKDKSFIGQLLFEAMPELENPIKEIFDKIMQSGIPFNANEMEVTMFRNGKNETGWFNVNYQAIYEDDNSISGILTSANEVTDQVLARKKIEDSDKRYNMMLMHSPFTFAVLKGKDLVIALANDRVKAVWGKGNDIEGKSLLEIMPELIDTPFPALLEEVRATGIPYHGKEVQSPPNVHGHVREEYFNFVFQPYLEADETISGITIIGNDVTEQVIAKRKIEESELRYNNLVYSSPFAIGILLGQDLVITTANDAIIKIWGKGKEIIGKKYFEALPELAEQGYKEVFAEVYKTGKPFNAVETPVNILQHGKMTLKYYNFLLQAQRNILGEIEGVGIIATEVTPQAILNKKIKESEAFNRAVLESSPDCIKMLDAEGRLQFMNVNGICLLEIDDFESLKNTYWWDMWETDNRQTIKDAVTTAKRGEKIQLQLFSPTLKGTPKWWDIIVLPVLQDESDKKLHQILSVSRDITKQKLNELKEKELLTRFQNLVVEAPVAICILRGESYVIEVINKGMYEMWDRTLEEALNKPAFEVLPELMEQGFKELLDNVYKTGERFVADELPINLKRNGKTEEAYVKFVYEPLREADGRISGVMALAHEITEQVIARKKIEQSETKFRALIEDAPVATCLFTGREMTVEVANHIMIGYWGKDKNVIGKTLADAVPELKGQPFLQILDDVFTTGKPYESKNAYAQLKLNGVLGEYYFDYTYKPIFNAAGEVYGIMDMAVDVTEQVIARKKIEESEKQFRQMAELMPQKIWTADAEGNKNYFNQTLLDYTGFTFEELKGSGWQKIIHPDDWEKNKKQWEESLSTGQDYEIENRLLRKDGEYLWHLTRAVALKDDTGEIKIWVGAKTEIQKIKEEEERQGDFIKMVSHELKTPITSIKGYVQLLLSMLKDKPETEVAGLPLLSSLTRIDSQVLRLTRLIKEMLDLTRLETGMLELNKELFGLDELVNETVKDITFTNTSHVINVHTDFTGIIYGDKDRLGQVLINLINNAIKYSPNNNPIDVNIHQPENNLIAVSVKDYGIGINKADQLKIFERFFRAGGKSEQTYPGFGIGLFIVNQIIERHQGFVSVESEKGKGSTFTFTLPLAAAI